MKSDVLLEMKDICKSFGGVRALDKVSLRVRRGTVHALMGENGAGKSTLMKCLFGIYSRDSGEILLDGKEISFKSPKEALEGGVAMVHQELNQALKRSVADNVWLGRYPTKFGFITQDKEAVRKTEEIFLEMGISLDPRKIMSEMSVSQRQMAEIAKALSYNARVIVLDEPTSSLNEKEVARLFTIIERLKENGCSIIYISHKMEEILRISDDVTVMRDGCHIATHRADELDMNKLIRLMVGRELTRRFPEKTNRVGDVMLTVSDMSSLYANLHDASFSLRRGEILGIAGLDGAGKTELLENLFGLSARKSASITLDGRRIENKNPRDSIKNGFAMITEERRASGIFSVLGILDNTVISRVKEYRSPLLALDRSKMIKDTRWAISAMKIKAPSIATAIRTLSGGNQQKVILGRWLLTDPKVLLLDEPTRGIDVGAKLEIYQLIIELASKGRSVIMVSSEMPELLGVCNRILVMSAGRVAGVLDAESASQEEIMKLATKFV